MPQERARPRRIKGCDQCQVLCINGVACHELGCPDRHLDPITGLGYRQECRECGRPFRLRHLRQEECPRCLRRLHH
jgi:hypothetical protein